MPFTEERENDSSIQQEVTDNSPCEGENSFPILLQNGEIPEFSIQENIIIEEISEDAAHINFCMDEVIQNSIENHKEIHECISSEIDTRDPDYDPIKENNQGTEDNTSSSEDERDTEYNTKNPEQTEDKDCHTRTRDIQNDELENEETPAKKPKFLVTREKRAKNKYLRMRGKAYNGLMKDEDGKYKLMREVGSRKIGPPCTSQKCQRSKVFKCHLFREIERAEIFQKFWEDLTWDMKRTYISGLVDSVAAKRKKENSRRNETLLYNLKKGTEKVRVCKKMFLATLGVSEWTVKEYSSKKFGLHIADEDKSMEKRGRGKDSVKEKKKLLNKYLDELPKMPSHYCRASTSKLYLEPTFQSQLDLYREYTHFCEENGQQPFSEKVLKGALKEKNIKLYRPRKDQCDLCIGHKLGNINDEQFTSHQNRKEMARCSKEEDKKSCIASHGKVAVLTVDVQAVKRQC